MNASSKVKCATALLLGIATAVMLAYAVRGKYGNQFDLNLRYYEVCASHEGINPFLVWDRKVKSDRYAGWERPDKPVEDLKEGQHYVHAYPPWHTTFFYFYGWMSNQAVGFLSIASNVMMVLAMTFCLMRFCRERALPTAKSLCVVCIMGACFSPMIDLCLRRGNYSILIATLSLALYWALDRKHQVLAGMIWAVMLVKPQVAALFCWPLLFSKCYKTICVAFVTLTLATIFPACLYGQSPLELLLEVPKIGAPYIDAKSRFCGPWMQFMLRRFGDHGTFAMAAVGSALCGLLSFCTRNYKRWWMKTIPTTAIIPYWTYYQEMDFIIGWNIILIIALVIVRVPFPLTDCKTTEYLERTES